MLVRNSFIFIIFIIFLAFGNSVWAWRIPLEFYDNYTTYRNGFPKKIAHRVRQRHGSGYHFSRANCHFPIFDDDWNRNESVTWDSVSAVANWTEVSKGTRQLYAIVTDSAHYFLWGGTHYFDHRIVSETRLDYIASATHHDDNYNRSGAVYGRHFYKGPGYLRDHNMNANKLANYLSSLHWEQLSDTYAKDCNLYGNQFFGNYSQWVHWWNSK